MTSPFFQQRFYPHRFYQHRFYQHSAEATLYSDGARHITAADFAGMARALAARLPAQTHVLNLCDDRLFFMVGFAAALLRGQPTLLPGNRSAHHLAELLQTYPDTTLLCDDVRFAAGLPHLCITSSLLDAATDRRAIDIDDATPAAVLFTSGSTGTPSAHHKTWGMLTQGARVLGDGLGLADQPGTLLSSVPQQHMFGLESTILLPLQSGFTLAAGCPLLPSDVHAAIAQHAAPLWWMTTPMHLRACVDSGLSFSPLAGILSSTQTLAPELARAAEACFQTRVHEVYGCTEAGLIGLRRTAHEAAWHLCADLDMASDAEHTLVSGERSGAALKLHDHIERLPGRRFVLHGRYADLIKVGGKRMNLHALNQLLRSLPGVDDAVFFQPDAGARLHAFVVAPTLDRPRILAALRGRIDPAFLPRPLHLLDALPRNAMGKLSHQALLELAQQLA